MDIDGRVIRLDSMSKVLSAGFEYSHASRLIQSRHMIYSCIFKNASRFRYSTDTIVAKIGLSSASDEYAC
jgi:hypothetical protein